MQVTGDKKSTKISLDIHPLFFHIFSKLFQALIITYDEIFQAQAVEGDVLLLKPFLYSTPPTVQPQLGPLGLTRVWQSEKTSLRPAKPRSGFLTSALVVSSDGNCWPWRCLFSLQDT
jgi:hypothetical protein